MPIKIICEKRHHLGEPDIFYPAVFCDLCGDRITDASKANYYWRPDYTGTNEEFYEKKYDVFFMHCLCDRRIQGKLREDNREHFDVKTPFGILKSEDVARCWWRLEKFPDHLARNLTPDQDQDDDESE